MRLLSGGDYEPEPTTEPADWGHCGQESCLAHATTTASSPYLRPTFKELHDPSLQRVQEMTLWWHTPTSLAGK